MILLLKAPSNAEVKYKPGCGFREVASFVEEVKALRALQGGLCAVGGEKLAAA